MRERKCFNRLDRGEFYTMHASLGPAGRKKKLDDLYMCEHEKLLLSCQATTVTQAISPAERDEREGLASVWLGYIKEGGKIGPSPAFSSSSSFFPPHELHERHQQCPERAAASLYSWHPYHPYPPSLRLYEPLKLPTGLSSFFLFDSISFYLGPFFIDAAGRYLSSSSTHLFCYFIFFCSPSRLSHFFFFFFFFFVCWRNLGTGCWTYPWASHVRINQFRIPSICVVGYISYLLT